MYYNVIIIYLAVYLHNLDVLKRYIYIYILLRFYACVFGSCRCSCGFMNKLQDCQLGRALLQLSKLRVKWTNQINIGTWCSFRRFTFLAAITHSRIDRETFPSMHSNDFQNAYKYIHIRRLHTCTHRYVPIRITYVPTVYTAVSREYILTAKIPNTLQLYTCTRPIITTYILCIMYSIIRWRKRTYSKPQKFF